MVATTGPEPADRATADGIDGMRHDRGVARVWPGTVRAVAEP
jgi:hypothetical protein